MKGYSGRVYRCLFAVSFLMVLGAWFCKVPASAQTLCGSTYGLCVKTWQQDTPSEVCNGCAYRTGANLQETRITAGTIQNDNFQKLCTQDTLDGQVYAQPLVVTGVTINQQTYPNPLVYVVTQNDTLYQIDGTTCAIVNHLPFLSTSGLPTNGQFAATCQNIGGKDCQTINPTVGILGTPVISISSDGTSGSIYLVTETQDNATTPSNWYHYLYKVDVQSLAVQASVLISPPGGGATVFSETHIQRAGLLYVPKSLVPTLSDDYVYVAFSMMDGYAAFNLPNGAIFGYDAATVSNATKFYYQTSLGPPSQSSYGGGIWMGGAAPAFGPDKNGSYWIYVTTANGTFDLNSQSPPNSDSGDSFLKLNPYGLTIAPTNTQEGGYLTPVDQYFRWQNNPVCQNNSNGERGGDTDYGSAGVLLIPDNELAKYPYAAVNGEKEGGIWFMDRTNPGGYNTQCGNSCNNCTPGGDSPSGNIQTFWTGTPYAGKVIYGGLTYWDYESSNPGPSYLYAGLYSSTINGYPLCGGTSDTLPLCQGSTKLSTSVSFNTGATPTLSAATAHASDALVWAIGGQKSLQCGLNKKPPCNPPTNQGVLYAFDALSLGSLYSSATCSPDAINPSTKFSVPTVANGYVYVGTESDNVNRIGQGTFYIFGPSGTACHN